MGKAVVFGALAVVVLGGAYAGAAAYSGNVVQKEYETAFDKMTQTLPFLKVVDRKYDKGLLSATVTYSLQLGCPSPAGEAGAKPVTLTLRDDIAHGPLPGFASAGLARIDTRIVLPPEAPESLRKWVDSMKPDAIRTVIGFDGAMSVNVALPEGEITDKDARVRWKALRGAFRMNGAHTIINDEYEVPEIAFEAAKEGNTVGFKLVNLRGQSTGAFTKDSFIGSGSGAGTIDLIQIASAREHLLIEVNQIKLAATKKVDNDFLDTSASLIGAANVKVGERVFKFDKIELQESMKRLHAPTLNKIALKFWQELGGMCDAPPEDIADSVEKKQAELLAGMKELLPYNPEYSVDKIAVTFAGQEGMLAYSVGANGVTGEDLQQPDMHFLPAKIIAKASVRLPIAWLKKIVTETNPGKELPQAAVDAAIGDMVNTGYVVREGDFLTSAALFEHGQLTVNGTPVDSSALFGLAPPEQPDGGEEENKDAE